MKILLLFTHLQVVPNLYEFISSAQHKRRYFEDVLSTSPISPFKISLLPRGGALFEASLAQRSKCVTSLIAGGSKQSRFGAKQSFVH